MATKPAKRTSSLKAAKPPSSKKSSAKAPPARHHKSGAASKLDRVIAALRAPKGATIPDLMRLTGWQAHSVRGALSGALKKKRGFAIASKKTDGERVYRIETRK